MNQSVIYSYDELPLFLNAEMVAKILGMSRSTVYELFREKGLPALHVGNRTVVPKEKFCQWVDANTQQ